jgi:hypothetical protein
MDVPRVTPIWKIVMNPHGVFMEGISNVFFDTTSKVTNTRYFKSQQFAFEHGDEHGAINRVFREECAIGLVLVLCVESLVSVSLQYKYYLM